MEERLKLSRTYIIACVSMIVIGIVTLVIAFAGDPQRAWANYLLNNVYFLSLAVGAMFFVSIQRVTHSGWSAGFIRVPEAMGAYIPVAAVLFLLLIPGAHSLYHWSHAEAVAHDPLLAHKAPYLNLPFWVIRMVVFFGLWILMTWLIRRLSKREDAGDGGLGYFKKGEHYAKIYIFIVIITFSFAMIDWIMSIDAHWYSTIFAVRNFVAAFHHAAIIITFIVLILHQRGYFPFLSKSHVGDFSRYIFMLCIIWGYFWFAEFMLIWYGNIPEETTYFVTRVRSEDWRIFFFANLIINWFLPFALLMPKAIGSNKMIVKIVIPILIVGQFIDLYLQIFPGSLGKQVLGFQELGIFIGFTGLFMLVVGYALSKANLYPLKHPYMEESKHHHT